MDNILRIIPKLLLVRLKSKLENPRVFKLTLATTFMCNSQCRTCNIWKIYKSEPGRAKEEVTENTYYRLYRELRNDLAWLEWTGGEPLLRPDICRIISRAYRETSIIAGGFTTNGLLGRDFITDRTERILKAIPPSKDLVVGVSIDGTPKQYARIRGVDGFAKAVETFLALKELKNEYKNFIPHIAYTISTLNAGMFMSFFDYINKKFGVRIEDFSFSIEHSCGFYQREQSVAKNDAMIGRMISDVKGILSLKSCSKSGTSLLFLKDKFYTFYLKGILLRLRNPGLMVIPCAAGTFSSYIDPYGNVYPCTMWTTQALGNITCTPFYVIWHSKRAKAIRKAIERGKCPTCWTPCEAQASWVANFERIIFR
jgi:sulfatase maturation enzyme AslB (radical SAM superfamily)